MQYQDAIKKYQVKPPKALNFMKSFFFGGLIAFIGQCLIELFLWWDFSLKNAQSLMIVILIFVSSLLTALGVYDKFGQIAKGGSIIPITGFANSMTSAAMEGRQEGIILGIGSGLFKLAGSVITFGVVSSYLLGIIRYFVEMTI